MGHVGASSPVGRFDYYTTRGMGTVPKFASVSSAAAIAWVTQYVAHIQSRRPCRLLKIVEVLEATEVVEEPAELDEDNLDRDAREDVEGRE